MRNAILPAAALVLLLPVSGAGVEPTDAIDVALGDALRETVSSTEGILLDDRLVASLHAVDALDSAGDAYDIWTEESSFPPRAATRFARFMVTIASVRSLTGDSQSAQRDMVLAVRRAAKAGYALRRTLPRASVAGFDLKVGGAGFQYAGRRLAVRLARGHEGPCHEVTSATVTNDGPGVAVETEVEDRGRGRLRLRMGSDMGLATLTVEACGVTRSVRLFNMGAPGELETEPFWGFSGSAPHDLLYPADFAQWRVGTPVTDFVPVVTGGFPEEYTFSIDPPLPAGLSLDPSTGEISGTPEEEGFGSPFLVTAANIHGSALDQVDIEVGPPLPPEFEFLFGGYAAEPLLQGLAIPVKMALAPDGRIFFNELVTGNVRVVDADGVLLETPFATVTVQTGVERGLLGLALAPDFATSGRLYVYAIVPESDPKPVRGQVIRFTADGDVGTDPTVIVDDLPAGLVQNGGDLQFGPDGNLYLSVGDTGDSSLAQADGERAGRILRFEPDGSIPADNPIPGDPEWCRGLRNPFDIAFHAGTGGLFGTENGPTAGDEVNLLLGGRNYAWETLPEEYPLHQVGPRIAYWGPVIVPTGLAFRTDARSDLWDGVLMLCGYDEADIRVLVLSGPSHADVDMQFPFARWDDSSGVDNKPLDIVDAQDGSLLVSTFSAIWRIDRYDDRRP